MVNLDFMGFSVLDYDIYVIITYIMYCYDVSGLMVLPARLTAGQVDCSVKLNSCAYDDLITSTM